MGFTHEFTVPKPYAVGPTLAGYRTPFLFAVDVSAAIRWEREGCAALAGKGRVA